MFLTLLDVYPLNGNTLTLFLALQVCLLLIFSLQSLKTTFLAAAKYLKNPALDNLMNEALSLQDSNTIREARLADSSLSHRATDLQIKLASLFYDLGAVMNSIQYYTSELRTVLEKLHTTGAFTDTS